MIFTLNNNGLIYQLPSHSGMIRTDKNKSNKYNKEDKEDKEYIFIRVFKLNSHWISYGDDENKQKKYKRIYFMDDDYNILVDDVFYSSDVNYKKTDTIMCVLYRMLQIYGKMNDTLVLCPNTTKLSALTKSINLLF